MMSFDSTHTDLLLQYTLLVAGEQDDPFDRQLGPIHLIKYVYLADLAYAQCHGGQTFSGSDWKFHNFGPWSNAVHERIEPALRSMGATCKSLPSGYEDRADWNRWSMRDDQLLIDRERKIPSEIALWLRGAIRKYRHDTPSLLGHVYRTAPMLAAAPSEMLDFSIAANQVDKTPSKVPALRMDGVSEKAKKRLRERLERVKQTAAGSGARKNALINPVKKPCSPEVIADGVSWLDSLAGDEFSDSEIAVEFSDDVWKSPTRKGNDVPN
jgi:hypothetical protein